MTTHDPRERRPRASAKTASTRRALRRLRLGPGRAHHPLADRAVDRGARDHRDLHRPSLHRGRRRGGRALRDGHGEGRSTSTPPSSSRWRCCRASCGCSSGVTRAGATSSPPRASAGSELSETFAFYLFLSDRPAAVPRPQPPGGRRLRLVFVLYLVMIVTGLGLYADRAPTRSCSSFPVLVPLFGGLQTARWIHHVVMWLLLGFVVHHVYSATPDGGHREERRYRLDLLRRQVDSGAASSRRTPGGRGLRGAGRSHERTRLSPARPGSRQHAARGRRRGRGRGRIRSRHVTPRRRGVSLLDGGTLGLALLPCSRGATA